MKIIDAHLHFVENEFYFDQIALAAGHENSEKYLRKIYRMLGIERGIVMGNRTLSLEDHIYPEFLSYCIGLDNSVWNSIDLTLIEKHLARRECVGIKLYPGYLHFYIYDNSLKPLYKLAQKFDKPIAVHTGLMAGNNYSVPEFCQPQVIARAAEKFSQNRFVMCHFGEPMFKEASEVLKNFQNVSADLSGMLEGKMSKSSFSTNYIQTLKNSLKSIGDWNRLMFGTDFPLANLQNYIEFTKSIVPQIEWEKVFYSNAIRIYNLR